MTDTMQRPAIIYIKTYDLWHGVRAERRVEFGDNNEVHLGFFRYYDYTKKKDDGYGGDGLAIWLDQTGVVVAAINGKVIEDHYNVFDDHRKVWLPEVLMSCFKEAVSEDYYFTRVETGTWPDQNEAVTKLAEQNRERIGGNNPPRDDSFDGLQDQINTLVLEVNKLLKGGAAQTKQAADDAGDLADALCKLWNKADKAREIEKAPHWQKCCEIQAKWNPLLSAAEVYKRVKQIVITPWQIKAEQQRQAELRRQREEADRIQREADEAQRRADEEAQRIADEAARAAQAGLSSPEDEKQARDALEEAAREADLLKEQAAEANRQADETAKSTVKVGGSRGRSIPLKTFHIAKCVDRRKASTALRDNGDFLTDIDVLIERYARKLKEDGIELPGVEYSVEQRAA